jgi:tRNA-specific 2-thiouridylase
MALARRVAAKLDIPFYVIDAKELFHSTVVQFFLEGYAQGVTPNPCLICNRQIKWDFLLGHAMALGADYLATGHYAKKQQTKDGTWQLLRSTDPLKDQSYILHVLTQEKLAKALFPVGEYLKSEIRKMAKTFDLPTSTRPDSQDLCFLAGEDYREFLRRNSPQIRNPGLILDRRGKTLGEHQGLAFYTIGQRKGLGVASPVPLYVLAKNAFTNTLVVGSEDELGSSELIAKNVCWISGDLPKEPFRAEVKTRYTAREAWAEIRPLDQIQLGGKFPNIEVHFDAPQRDITPGQAAVFYDGDIVLGGGVIA